MTDPGQVKFGQLWRLDEFRALWSAELLSVLGDQLARVALSLLVFAQTSSALLTGLTYALTFVPALLGGLLLSGLADRFPRRRVIVLTDLTRAALAGAMALPDLPLPVLWILIGVLTLASAPFKAAQLSLLPDVLGERAYQAGVALRQVGIQTAQIAGFALGGIAVAALTPQLVLLVNATTFIVSAVLVGTCVRARASARAGRVDKAGADQPEPAKRSSLVPVYLIVGLTGLFVVPEGLAAPYAGALGSAAFAVGILMAADPLGSVLGAWIAARRAVSPTLNSLLIPAFASGLPLVACIARPGLVVSALLWAVSGALSTLYLVRMQPYVVANVPNHRRGTVLGRLNTCLYASQGIAILGGGVLAEQVSVFASVAIAGALGAVLVLAITVYYRPRLRTAHAGEQRPPENNEERQSSLFRIASSWGRRGHGTPAATGEDAGTGAPPGKGSSASMRANPVGEYPSTRRSLLQVTQFTHWRLWTRPRPAAILIIGIDLVAVAATIFVGVALDPSRDDVLASTILVGLGLLAAEMSLRVERMRRHFSDTPHVNLSSVWTFSAVLLLPPALTAAVVIVLYAHLWLRIWRKMAGMHTFRVLFNIANVLLSCYISFWFAQLSPLQPFNTMAFTAINALWLGAIIAVYFVVNSAILAAVIALLRTDRSIQQLLGRLNENVLELATLCMGGLTALLLLISPWFTFLVFLPLYALHRSVLIRQYEHAATTDSKTGLLNMTSWRALAEKELERSQRNSTVFGVLMIDIDHFRQVNNEYGHLAGDEALQAVADALKQNTRSYDLCGRFGGEEFVVLLPETTSNQLLIVAERICQGIRDLEVTPSGCTEPLRGLSVSIGAAAYPTAGTTLDDVLMTADNCLFAAKNSGRDRVRTVEMV
ncbi:MFS transporter [Kibdelosporangium aridum]|uniref:Diguanylate cyclase (GGDEF) domain-containing protein n=1 Tax=Kibdelosporangium aridum TaxID=2030 RepID=A0A1W2FZY5_KIBAR|nr:MFS transporter [Kibdelosporangium aridum]SMD27433.1 diguanylate cyclase (GGDEF) domain-containing protein [Kibdelosporangium aridum]